MEDILSFVHTVKNQDEITSSDSHGCVCFNDDRICIPGNESLNGATSTHAVCCFSHVTVHDAAAIGVDIPSHRPMDSLELVTWNLASPNNNPFELWVRG